MGIISSLPASCTNVYVKAFFFMNQEEDDGRLVSTFNTCILDHPRMLTSADEQRTNIFRKVLFWPRVAKFGRGCGAKLWLKEILFVSQEMTARIFPIFRISVQGITERSVVVLSYGHLRWVWKDEGVYFKVVQTWYQGTQLFCIYARGIPNWRKFLFSQSGDTLKAPKPCFYTFDNNLRVFLETAWGSTVYI